MIYLPFVLKNYSELFEGEVTGSKVAINKNKKMIFLFIFFKNIVYSIFYKRIKTNWNLQN
ncbi:hypothetical protein BpHYR1_004492 [Brachionus plicatilis]|uniref:Uncharacterized protein n=1 Tax=Brachionus plicatilis TaxID=10195 RepID=A0A3M7S9N9_BRAPC|nr:hypothetical protein BpHYR1_004492 [Brachionus plicatilis]